MQKFIESLNNILKLISSLATLAVVGGIIFGCLWAYRKVAEFTATPIQMPTVKLPDVQMPKIKVEAPTIDMGGLFGKKNEEPDRGDVVEKAINQGWADWQAETDAFLATCPHHSSIGRWRSFFDGKTLKGIRRLPPPGVTIQRSDNEVKVINQNYSWTGEGLDQPLVPLHSVFIWHCFHKPQCQSNGWECILRHQIPTLCEESPKCTSTSQFLQVHADEYYKHCMHRPMCADKATHVKEFIYDLAYPDGRPSKGLME